MKTVKLFKTGFFLALLLLLGSCRETEYSLGELTPPANLVVNIEIVGQTPATPNGDGSGDINVTATARNVIAYKIDFGLTPEPNFVPLVDGRVSRKMTRTGTHPYTITVVAYGAGGSSTTVTQQVTVRMDWVVNPVIVTNLTNNASKTWVVDRSVDAHFRVGPWADPATIWWSAGIDDKVDAAPCFYTAQYIFTRTGPATFTVRVVSPLIFANASRTNLPMPAGAAGEACYPFVDRTRALTFAPAETGILPPFSTQTNFIVDGIDGFVGYGSASNTYEILEITDNYMYVRTRGVNAFLAWYLKFRPIN